MEYFAQTSMQLVALRAVLEPFVAVFGAILLSGTAVVIATQIMKLRVIPIPVQKYPRLTAAIASGVAALVSLYNSSVNFVVDSVWGWLALAIGTYIVAAVAYNNIVKGSEVLEVTSTKPEEGSKL